MRKKYISLLLTLLAVFTSCDDKLDITPRGFSTLNTVDDLGALINKEWRIYDWDFNHEMITGNTFALWSTPEEIFNVKNSVEYAFIYADESVDRVALCEEDERYKEIYSNIKYCNIVACQMPDLDGDQYKKNRFIAQARIPRAWFHFLAVNLWAAQYDEATAASTGGVPYVDNIDFGAEKTKLTVAQVYEKILADCSDELIECLDKTPTDDPFRFEADFGYAVRARVLFQMKRYEEAATYARKALGINPTIEDRSTIVDKGTWESTFNSPNHYMFILTSFVTNQSEMGNMTLTPKFLSLYEQGDYVRYYSREDDWTEYDDLLYGPEGSANYSPQGAARINVWGLRAEQMYYVLGECLIRAGQIDEGLDQVDKVRKYRIHPEFYRPFKGTVNTKQEAMALLSKAKTVECIISYENFCDCKRRNTEPEYAADVVHHMDDFGDFTIRPNSPLWIYPFPMNATNFNPSLTQNI